MKKTRSARRFLSQKIKSNFENKLQCNYADSLRQANPIVRASYLWMILSEQLETMLGPEVYYQWFQKTRAYSVIDQTLILVTPNHFAAQWIHQNYQPLVDTLLSVHDPGLSSLFLSHHDVYPDLGLTK